MPCEEWPKGLGLALKIEDGDDKRARPTVVIESLRQLGVLRDESLEAVSRYAFFPVQNRRGDVVGEFSASFTLKKLAYCMTSEGERKPAATATRRSPGRLMSILFLT